MNRSLAATVGALALVASVSLVGCSSGGSSMSGSSASSASQTPSTPPTPTYSAPADNEAAALIQATHVPDCCTLQTDDTQTDRLGFASASSTDEMIQVGKGEIYMIEMVDSSTTVDSWINDFTTSINGDGTTVDISPSGQVTIDGESADTASGTAKMKTTDDRGSLAVRAAIVTHNDQTFAIFAAEIKTDLNASTDNLDFDAFLAGIRWVN